MKKGEFKDENEMFIDSEDSLVRAFAGFMLAIVVVCVVGAFCLCLGGCRTNGITGDVADIVARDAELRGRLEATVESLDGTIRDSDSQIRLVVANSRKITNLADRIEYLFNCYEAEVKRLVNKMRGASDEIKDSVESYLEPDRNAPRVDSGVRGAGVAGEKEDN